MTKRNKFFFLLASLCAVLAACSEQPTDTSEMAPENTSPSIDASYSDNTKPAQSPSEKSDTFTLVMLGDSITAGYGLENSRLLTDSLDAYLDQNGAPVELINAGVSGDRMQDGAARFDWSVGPEADGVFIALGGNDLLRGIETSVTRANLKQMLNRAKERGLWVAVAGLPAPGNASPQFAEEFNALYSELSLEYCAPLLSNFLDGVIGDPTLNQEDGIHPTAEGVEVLVTKVGPWLRAAIDGAHNPCTTE